MSAWSADQLPQPVALQSPACTRPMQSTGQTGRHSSQPVQNDATTVCIRLLAPKIASVGQASRHSVHPMHQFSSMTAKVREVSTPCSGLRGSTGRCTTAAMRCTPSAPPGGHWSTPACCAAPDAMHPLRLPGLRALCAGCGSTASTRAAKPDKKISAGMESTIANAVLKKPKSWKSVSGFHSYVSFICACGGAAWPETGAGLR